MRVKQYLCLAVKSNVRQPLDHLRQWRLLHRETVGVFQAVLEVLRADLLLSGFSTLSIWLVQVNIVVQVDDLTEVNANLGLVPLVLNALHGQKHAFLHGSLTL